MPILCQSILSLAPAALDIAAIFTCFRVKDAETICI
jgi:hypothetical protein